jgi:hypothetical protein
MAGSKFQSSKKPNTRDADERTGSAGEESSETPFEILKKLPEKINPAILLAEEMLREGMLGEPFFEDFKRAERVLRKARREIERVESQFKALVKTPPSPADTVPKGF